MCVSVIVFHLTFRFETAQARRTSKRSVCGGLYTPQGYCMTRVESQADTTSMTSRTEYSTQTPKKSTIFSGQYLRNHWTLDIGVLGYIGIVWPKEHSPESGPFLLLNPVYVWVDWFVYYMCILLLLVWISWLLCVFYLVGCKNGVFWTINLWWVEGLSSKRNQDSFHQQMHTFIKHIKC